MTIESKRKPRLDNRDRDERERKRQEEVGHERMRQEEALDEALKNTFPASDPVSVGAAIASGAAPYQVLFGHWWLAPGPRSAGAVTGCGRIAAKTSAPAMSNLSWLSPVATQHSLSRTLPFNSGRTSTGRIAPACGWRTHSMTSSARAVNAADKVMPSAVAVFRLIAK